MIQSTRAFNLTWLKSGGTSTGTFLGAAKGRILVPGRGSGILWGSLAYLRILFPLKLFLSLQNLILALGLRRQSLHRDETP